MKKKLLYVAAGIVGLLVAALLIAAAKWPVINVVETGRTAEYPNIAPQYYSADPGRVFSEAKAGVEALERWSLVEADQVAGTIKATRTSRLGFVDDIDVKVVAVTEFATQVDVRSASRVGKGDLGQNARNIETFFAELDTRLGAVKFDPRAPNGDVKTPKK